MADKAQKRIGALHGIVFDVHESDLARKLHHLFVAVVYINNVALRVDHDSVCVFKHVLRLAGTFFAVKNL